MIDVTQHIPGIIHIDALIRMYSDEAAGLLSAAAHSFSMACQVDGAEKTFDIQPYRILAYAAVARREDGMLVVRVPNRRTVVHRSGPSVYNEMSKYGRGVIAGCLTSFAASIRQELLKAGLPLEQELKLLLPDSRPVATTYSRFKAFRRAFMLLSLGAGALSGEELELAGHAANPIVASALAETRREWVELHRQRCLADLDDEAASMAFRENVKKLLKPFSYDESVLERELDNELRRELL